MLRNCNSGKRNKGKTISHESKANSELQAESQSIPSSLQKITRAGKAYAVEIAEELDFEDMAGLEFDDPRLSNKGPIPTTVPKSFKDAVSCVGHLWWVVGMLMR